MSVRACFFVFARAVVKCAIEISKQSYANFQRRIIDDGAGVGSVIRKLALNAEVKSDTKLARSRQT